VVDFRWHRVTKSPNWFVIDDKDRVQMLDKKYTDVGWSLKASASDMSAQANKQLPTPGSVVVTSADKDGVGSGDGDGDGDDDDDEI